MDEVAKNIAGEISASGVIPFARFMELALYCPVYGYYEREKDTIGRRGDYFTSVSVGPVFGELLAYQFADWLQLLSPQPRSHELRSQRPGPGSGASMQIVEAGAHDGRLAMDILSWMQKERPGLYAQLEYWILEPSDPRRERQQRGLGRFGDKVRWVKELGPKSNVRNAECTDSSERLDRVRGIVFCNELLDAMPVHRLGWDATSRTWFEWGVTVQRERFVWARMDSSDPRTVDRRLWTLDGLGDLGPFLPDGFTIEICPSAVAWWRQAAGALERGKLLTIDYGLTVEELLAPERKNGTLRAYARHQIARDVLEDPGRQDITAHVDFTALQAAGESLGLRTETFVTQAQFLTRIAKQVWERKEGAEDWIQERRRQFQTLTHPEHLGRAFRVLVQARG